MVALAHLIAEFSLRVALDVYLAAQLPFHAAKCGKQMDRCNIAHDEKIYIALGSFFAASDRPVDGAPMDFVTEPC